jgi:hypothetical protein
MDSSHQRVTITVAADRLGITEAAVRKRIERGTIDATKGDDGRSYVLLPRDSSPDVSRELVDLLKEQLEAERQAHAETRRLLAGLIERVPALEAPPPKTTDERESPHTVEEAPQREPHSATGGAQEGAEKPWWRRVFGG